MKHKSYSKGQIAVIIALVLPVMIGAVALGADFAIMYFNWVQLQKAADAAALAGAGYLPNDTTGANNAANTYATTNGRNGDTINITVDGSSFPSFVQVQMTRQVPYYFGRVLGLTNATLSARAQAGIKSINATNGQGGHVLPIGIDCPLGFSNCLVKGQSVTLGASQVGPGDWGYLDLPGMNGVSNVRQTVADGWVSPDPSNPNDNVMADPNGQPGCTAGPTCQVLQPGNGVVQKAAQGVQDRITASQNLSLPGSPPLNPNLSDPRVVMLPMVNFAGVNGKSSPVPVLGFAEVWINGVNPDNSISVTFIEAVSPGGIIGTGGNNTTCVQGASAPCLVVLEQ